MSLQSSMARASCVAACAFSALLMLSVPAARAQGGPPMVTDDPETPGDGKWEINVAATGARNRTGAWSISAPDADINYGWGENIQLKIDLPWAWVREPGQGTRSGPGSVDVGVKWRFIDSDDAGYSLSTYPQLLSSWSASSRRRGLNSQNKEFFLPLEASTRVGEFGLDGEIGRNFVQHEDSAWIVGGIVAHGCGEGRECMIELRHSMQPGNRQTLLNLGMHWKLDESLTLLASAGREFGKRNDDQVSTLFYLGLQWTH